MAALTTIALSALALGGLTTTIVQGQRAAAQQRRALARQDTAQQMAASAAISQRRRADQDFAAANLKQPNASSILAAEQADAATGAASTMLTGPRAARGRASLLGDSPA
jgi:hypothetical protein